jgi:hypothetical protein
LDEHVQAGGNEQCTDDLQNLHNRIPCFDSGASGARWISL